MRSFFSGMCFRWKALRPIIAAPLLAACVAFALAGCSTLRLAYNNLPEVAYWWLDGYLDFDSTQSPKVREELAGLLAWHRRSELPRWIELLDKAQAMAPADTTPAQACELGEAIRARLLAVATRAEPAAAELAMRLAPAQLDHLSQKYARVNAEYRADWLDKSREQQQEKRYERWVDRSEDFYGRLSDAQKAAMRQMVAGSVFDAALFDVERRRRQAAMLALLRAAGADAGASAADVRAALHAYVRTVAEAPPGRWHEQQRALWLEGCTQFAALHNLTTPAQREEAARHLRGYEAELRTLAAQ